MPERIVLNPLARRGTGATSTGSRGSSVRAVAPGVPWLCPFPELRSAITSSLSFSTMLHSRSAPLRLARGSGSERGDTRLDQSRGQRQRACFAVIVQEPRSACTPGKGRYFARFPGLVDQRRIVEARTHSEDSGPYDLGLHRKSNGGPNVGSQVL